MVDEEYGNAGKRKHADKETKGQARDEEDGLQEALQCWCLSLGGLQEARSELPRVFVQKWPSSPTTV